MASHVRRKLERDVPPEWGDLLEVAAAARRELGPARKRVSPERWQEALDDDLKRMVWDGRLDEATQLLLERLSPGVRE